MNISISPIRSTAVHNKPAFKGFSDYDPDVDLVYTESDANALASYKADQAKFKSGLAGFGLCMVLATGCMMMDDADKKEKYDEFAEKVKEIASSKDVRQDSILIKDMNDDDSPDFVLFKKDGSKVIIDTKNQEITESKKKLDVKSQKITKSRKKLDIIR